MVAAMDIAPALRTNAVSTNASVVPSWLHIRLPRVAPTTLLVFRPLMRKGTEAIEKLTKLIAAIIRMSRATEKRVMVVERLPFAMLSGCLLWL